MWARVVSIAPFWLVLLLLLLSVFVVCFVFVVVVVFGCCCFRSEETTTRAQFSSVQFSSVQVDMYIMRSEKPICASPLLESTDIEHGK